MVSVIQDEVIERIEAIRKEYNELDTVWFMAGSLFQVIKSALEQVQLLKQLYILTVSSYIICINILQQYPYDIPTEAFSFEIFKQAFAAIQSCVVHLQVKFPCYPYISKLNSY